MVPEDGQAACQLEHALRVAGIAQETQRRAEVGQLSLDGPEAIVDALTKRNVVWLEPLIEGGEVRRVRRPCTVLFSRRSELLKGELPDRLQHPKAAARRRIAPQQQALVDQRGDAVQRGGEHG